MPTPEFSIVIPARDEEGNIRPLLEELETVMTASGLVWEVLVIDDASSDQTLARLREAMVRHPTLTVLHFPAHRGKSAALAAGIARARGTFIGLMDADWQNCPADFLPLLETMRREPGITLQQGARPERQDSWARRLASEIGRLARRVLLKDTVRDAGCAFRLLRRDSAVRLPLHFEGLHRFVPHLVALQGGQVREVSVHHRPRLSGQSKYHVGPVCRGIYGLLDLLVIRWMMWRLRPLDAEDISRCGGSP